MANGKVFTNTYIVGDGRQNYLRIDGIEEPLFTSFTFDVDYTSSPLFYTINCSDYGYPNDVGLANRIESALSEMYAQNMGEDKGYDILPMLSANFIDDKKLGFGLQQNVYTDLPLYGATEYIYMVDKRNGNGSQNDVRYDNNSGYSNPSNSYKLGDSVKEVVSESDRVWAENQRAQAQAQVAECERIMNDEAVIAEHEQNIVDMNNALSECSVFTETVEGETEPLNESQLQQKVNEYQQLESAFENLKRNICNWVNGELSAFRSRATSLYMRNPCVKKIMSYDDVTKSEHREELKRLYGDDFVGEYIWELAKKGNNSYLSKSLELYNEIETYARSRNTWCEQNHYKDDDGESLLIEKTANNGAVTVRPSLIERRFGDQLEALGFKSNGSPFEQNIQIRVLGECPEWAVGMADSLEFFAKDTKSLTETIIIDPLRYQCDMELSFNEFESQKVKENREKLIKYEIALENIRTSLYGFENGQPCDISNPSPYSPYGQYLAAKERCENDTYAQAERSMSMANSGIDEYNDILSGGEQSVSNNDENEPVRTESQMLEENSNTSTNIVVPQTVLDMLGFISGMKKMITQYPYIIQGISGLDKAYDSHYGIKDPYMGSGDNKISLTCWESLDLRVSSMFNRYFNAVYDRQYRRERVPVNLRRFNCSVYVHDVRNFISKNRSEYINRILELTDMYYSVIEFKFYDCEIVTEETGNIFNDISNESPSEMKKTNFTFTYGNCVVNFIPHSEIASY
jgi:hypothetical protein